MVANLDQIVRFLDAELKTDEVPDYDAALNGLQLANDGRVSRIAAAVDFSSKAVDAAVAQQASLLLVHHGMFWAGAQRIVGAAYERIRIAIGANLAVYASHLPLDVHPTLGNNALLARALELEPNGTFGRYRNIEVGVSGSSDVETAALMDRVRGLSARHGTTLVTTPVSEGRRTRRWAIVTGAGASSSALAEARERGIDTLIVGEGPHHTAVEAMDSGMVLAYAGHYATETHGVRAIAAAVSERFNIPWTFLDLPTGL